MDAATNRTTYAIDTHNVVATGLTAQTIAPEGALAFSTERELETLAAGWPISRLVEIWNGFPGHVRLKKFTNRKTAIRRIWQALESRAIPPSVDPPVRQAKGRKAKGTVGAPLSATATKSETVLALLRKPEGATLKMLMAATGWQSHSVRGFISGQLAKKQRLKVKSFKRGEERVYSIRSGPKKS